MPSVHKESRMDCKRTAGRDCASQWPDRAQNIEDLEDVSASLSAKRVDAAIPKIGSM